MVYARSLFDHHMHSELSFDSEQPMEELIETAIAHGKTHITFTEHADIINKATGYFCTDIPTYDKKIAEMRAQYPQITILRGTEVGFEKEIAQEVNDHLRTNAFDIRVLSIHSTFGGKDFADEFRAKGFWEFSDDVLLDYYQATLDAVQMTNGFQILGHVDYITRYTPETANTDLRPYYDLIAEVYRECIKKDVSLDINTAGIRYGLPYFHPQTALLKLYKDLGGKYVSLGSDAHKVADMNFYFKEASEALAALGFTHLTSFAEADHFQIPIHTII